MPDPCDQRGVRHALAVLLALTACAVLAGASSLLAVGEWIADAPPHVLERLGVRPRPGAAPAYGPVRGDRPPTAGPHRRRRPGPGGRRLAR
ncbi:transposase family protein [Streptacidiphilus sp. N1-3]|uniref:Transposase family protein n=1 Tax=Streptacidiphilus alkalitolerans TaxID=3342712 RepID=A0ABV6X3R3_9ACTN